MNTAPRIAMIIHDFLPRVGGAERQLAAIAPLLQRRGFEVHILTRLYQGLPRLENMQGVIVHRLPAPGPKPVASLIFTINIVNMLRRLKPNIVHSYSLLSPTTGAVASKRLFGLPVIVKVIGLSDIVRMNKKTLGNYRVAKFGKNVDFFAVVSKEIDTELGKLGIPAERRIFLPNGVDTDRFVPLSPKDKQSLRAALGLPDVPITIFVGRLTPGKRVDLLLCGWPQVRLVHPNAILLIIGSGAEEEKLKQMAPAGVEFTGTVENVLPYLQLADLFVLPSSSEGLSNALLEAMSSGLAVVATAIGGSTDLIEHETNGWMIPVGDGNALIGAINCLLSNQELRQKLAASARARIVRDYGLHAIVERYCSLYYNLLNGPQASVSLAQRLDSGSNRAAVADPTTHQKTL